MPGSTQSSHEGTLRYFPPATSCFELPRSTSTETPSNTLLWIGGLFDTYFSVSYPELLAQLLPSSWTLSILCLSSSGTQWGTSTLDGDRSEIASVVSYYRKQRPGGKVYLMGHSTGCQDAVHYACAPGERPKVDGIILQAPVSDKEALASQLGEQRKADFDVMARRLVDAGSPDDCVPSTVMREAFGKTMGLSAQRWLSLSSPDGKGQDDYFSSDLSDERHERSFGRVPRGTRMLLIYSEKDSSWLPKGIDVQAMLSRWKGFADRAGVSVAEDSVKLLKGASHNLNGDPEQVVQELMDRVLRFLKDDQANL